MKKYIALFVAIVILSYNAYSQELFATIEPNAVAIYVAPNGNDSNSGTIEFPLKTLQGAKDKIRKLKTGVSKCINAYFRSGEYKWNDTVNFNSEDSGSEDNKITYCAYPGETPIFTGGFRIPVGEFADEILSNGVSVKKINIKEYIERKLGTTVDYSEYYPLQKDNYGSGANGGYEGRMVYSIDDNPALWLARYPNKIDGFYDDNPHSNFMKIGAVIKETNCTNGDIQGSVFSYSDDRISRYAQKNDIWFFGFPKWLFRHEEIRIKNIDTVNKTIETSVAPNGGISENGEFIIFNIQEELDAPGEYYINKDTGNFYVYPNGNFTYLNLCNFNKPYMIKTCGTSNIIFDGISFENTRMNCIQTDGGKNVRIANCNFNNIGENGVLLGKGIGGGYTSFGNYNWKDQFANLTRTEAALKQYNNWIDESRSIAARGENHVIYGCIIKNIGLSGIVISGGNLYRDEDCGFCVENCDISFAGVNKRTYESTIRFDNCHGAIVKNNKLGKCPAAVLSGYITKGIIENNEIYDGLSESSDMGLVYLNYLCPTLDLVINNNYLHDVAPEFPITSSSNQASQRSAIAFDNIYGSGVKMTNNIIKNIPRGTFVTSMQTVVNNVFLDCFDPIYTNQLNSFNSWNISKLENGNPNDFYDSANIGMDLGGFSYMQIWPVFIEGSVGDSVRTLWNEKYPEIMKWIEIVESQSHKGKMFFNVHNNLFVSGSGNYWSGHKKLGDIFVPLNTQLNNGYTPNNYMNIYTTKTDCFLDYKKSDYRLTRSSIIKYSMNSVDISKIGIKR